MSATCAFSIIRAADSAIIDAARRLSRATSVIAVARIRCCCAIPSELRVVSSIVVPPVVAAI